MKSYMFLFGSSALAVLISMMNMSTSKVYNRCMGKEEQFYFNIPFFLDESDAWGTYNRLPIWNPYRLINLLLFFLSFFLAPYAYLRIFYFRKKLRGEGLNEKEKLRRKKKNLVSTGYNMAIWLFEGFVLIFVS